MQTLIRRNGGPTWGYRCCFVPTTGRGYEDPSPVISYDLYIIYGLQT